MNARRILLLATAIAAAVSCLSCGGDPGMPEGPLGAVYGYVTMGGEPAELVVMVVRMEEGRETNITSSVRADSTGFYRLDVPNGNYKVFIALDSSSRRLEVESDTFALANVAWRFDIHVAGVSIDVAVPAEFAGEQFTLYAFDEDGGRAWSLGGSVSSGVLSFPLTPILPGTYTFTLESWHTHGTVHLPGTRDPDAAEAFALAAHRIRRLEFDLSDQVATIEGALSGDWVERYSLSGMRLWVVGSDGWMWSLGRTEEDGTFSVPIFVPEPIRLRLSAGPWPLWYGGDSEETATVLPLAPGDRYSDLLFPVQALAVRLDGPGDILDPEASVALWNEDGHRVGLTIARGVEVCLLVHEPGEFRVFVDGNCGIVDFAPQWYGGTSLDDAAPVEVGAEQLTTIDMELVEGGGIEATVFEADGGTPHSVLAFILDQDGERVCSGLWSRRFTLGNIRFVGLADGAYHLGVATEQGGWWYPGTTEMTEAALVEVTGGETVTGITWSLPADLDGGGR